MGRLSKSAVGLVVWLVVVGHVVAIVETRADSPSATIYDIAPNHLWNRLHVALFVRTGPDGKVYGYDRLEPLLWKESQYLLKGKQADMVVTVLEEFLHDKGELLVVDPLKRVILQRDLWLVASWLSGRSDAESKKRLGLLAQVIQRLAPRSDQVAHLPDNYASAVASKKFAAEFDQANPERAYLPPDLFNPDGPWVCVGRTDGRTAPTHLGGSLAIMPEADQNPFTNSTFLVLLKLPAGREAALAFLKQLQVQPKPIFVTERSDEDGRFTTRPNRDLPELPVGSELALVRRALLIEAQGQIVASQLTESVQVRITTSARIPQADGGGLAEYPQRATVQEFQMRRADLFANSPIGLIDVSAERDHITGFSVRLQHDEFEVDRGGTDERHAMQPFQPSPLTRRERCFQCHQVSNFFGTRSFQRTWNIDERLQDKSLPMFPVAAMEVQAVETAAIKWKESQPGWSELRKLLSE
jgi:hypothetical protein